MQLLHACFLIESVMSLLEYDASLCNKGHVGKFSYVAGFELMKL